MAPRLLRAQLGVEHVANGVAEHVEAEHRKTDGDARPKRDPWRAFGILLRAALQHQSPGRRRLLHAETEIGERGLEEDGVPDAKTMIRQLVIGQETVARTARKLFPLVDAANDEPTADLLTQRMQVHEKTAWMLRSLLA